MPDQAWPREPWQTDITSRHTSKLDRKDICSVDLEPIANYVKGDAAARIVACVNALAGVRNVEAVSEWIKATQAWVDSGIEFMCGKCEAKNVVQAEFEMRKAFCKIKGVWPEAWSDAEPEETK